MHLYLVGVTDGARTRYLQSDSLMCLPLPLQPQICLDLVSETMVTEVILLTFPPHCPTRVGVTLTAIGTDARPTGYVRHYSNIAKLEHFFWLCT